MTAALESLRGKDRAGGPSVDLDAYCARIGYDGPRTATLATLRALHGRHIATIAFEAIDVLLDRGVDLSPASVDDKLIRRRRGGYCYEQNGLFKRVLETIGFPVEGLLARVRWMAPVGAPPVPRTHMTLRVTVDGRPWLADVGFGGTTPAAPLRMDTAEPQPTGHETHRMVPTGGSLILEARLGTAWSPLYEAPPEPQLDVDYELPNWFSATHPGSPFRRMLRVARTAPEARYTLIDGRFTRRSPDGDSERLQLDADGIERALGDTFGLPVETTWRPIIERAAASPPP